MLNTCLIRRLHLAKANVAQSRLFSSLNTSRMPAHLKMGVTKREARRQQKEKVGMDEFQKVKMMRGMEEERELPIVESETIEDQTMSQYFLDLEREDGKMKRENILRGKEQRPTAV